jgi:hypothetical protein
LVDQLNPREGPHQPPNRYSSMKKLLLIVSDRSCIFYRHHLLSSDSVKLEIINRFHGVLIEDTGCSHRSHNEHMGLC